MAARILPREPAISWASVVDSDPEFHSESVDLISNWYLLESNLSKQLIGRDFTHMRSIMLQSRFALTKLVAEKL